MKRRTFLGAIAALFITPYGAMAKPVLSGIKAPQVLAPATPKIAGKFIPNVRYYIINVYKDGNMWTAYDTDRDGKNAQAEFNDPNTTFLMKGYIVTDSSGNIAELKNYNS